MDSRLTDLDALILTVRNILSRSYIEEAVRAYRAGSYKAAIVAVWVAVSFDIISKIREIAEAGDAAARDFVTEFDRNVTANNTTRLLAMEANLLEDAEQKFSFIDAITRRHFERLKQDRNLCAHPAFTADGNLFPPEPELVRLYIVEAVRNLLSQWPVQGRTIIDAFDQDFKSAAFPTRAEEVLRYVEGRFLQHSRRNVLTSFAQVVAKALLKGTPPGWETKLSTLPYVLSAVKTHDAAIWTSEVRPKLVQLIETATDDYLPNTYSLLSVFPDVVAALPSPAVDRLKAFIENSLPIEANLGMFAAATIPELRDAAVAKFSATENIVMLGAALKLYPLQVYWPPALQRFRRVGSFRGAEALYGSLVMPFQAIATPSQLIELLNVVVDNSQISSAAGIPRPLAAFIRSVNERHPLGSADIAAIEAATGPIRQSGYFHLGPIVAEALREVGVPVRDEDAEA